jgi:peptide/nickel transport system substrate-binding protein
MRLTAWRLLVVASLITAAAAATRPHYGGTLRAQTKDRAVPPDLMFDTLVTFNDSAQPQPALATSWKHDADFKRWEFQLRTGVKFHDGTSLTGAAAAAALEKIGAIGLGDAVIIRSEQPAPKLLYTLAGMPIFKTRADGIRVGTGPFRLATETGAHYVFEANEDYWGGRPYLDAVEIDTGRHPRDQLLAFDLSKADVVELDFGDLRRITQSGKRFWTSPPVELIALAFEPLVDQRVREAIALSIGRSTIHSVLLQKQGVATGAILPQWLSGYSFLFPAARDLEKARQLGSGAGPVTIGYDPGDTTTRLIAERIAVNAREAGITVRTTGGSQAAGRIVRIGVNAPDPFQALMSVGDTVGIKASGTLYDVERTLLQGSRIVPLFHLPQIYGLGPRVRGWAPSRWGGWKLDSVWLAP